MIINKIKSTIYKHQLIQTGEHIVVGLSGGPDSVCLFHVLYTLKDEFNLKLSVVHINHQFRPGAAEEDQLYVEKLCEKYGVECTSISVDVNAYAKEQGLTSEEAGRKIRYKSFYKAAEKIRVKTKDENICVKIAVAQNLNDQAETLLMRIMRGTGVDGLAGIPYKREGEKNTEIIRPLLDTERYEIEDYCEAEELNPRIDATNSQPIYTRNKIRLGLIPYMAENYNENIIMSLNRLSKIAKIDKDYIAGVVEKTLKAQSKIKENTKWGKMATIPLRVMQDLHPALRHRVIINLFGEIGLVQDISATHLAGADYVIIEGRTSAMSNFPGDYCLQISYGLVEMFKKKENDESGFSYIIDIREKDISLKIGEIDGSLTAKLFQNEKIEEGSTSVDFAKKLLGNQWKSNFAVALSYDDMLKAGYPLILRSRMRGDWFVPQGMEGKKKIQNFFVDAKISKDERDSIPLLCLGTEVIWVVGSRISERYKVKDATDTILVLEYINDL